MWFVNYSLSDFDFLNFLFKVEAVSYRTALIKFSMSLKTLIHNVSMMYFTPLDVVCQLFIG